MSPPAHHHPSHWPFNLSRGDTPVTFLPCTGNPRETETTAQVCAGTEGEELFLIP